MPRSLKWVPLWLELPVPILETSPHPGAGGDRHAPSNSAGTNLNRENCQNFPKLTFCQIANWPAPPCHSQKRMSVNMVWHASTSPFISKNTVLGAKPRNLWHLQCYSVFSVIKNKTNSGVFRNQLKAANSNYSKCWKCKLSWTVHTISDYHWKQTVLEYSEYLLQRKLWPAIKVIVSMF